MSELIAHVWQLLITTFLIYYAMTCYDKGERWYPAIALSVALVGIAALGAGPA